jgi:ABC-type multidrug transport system ATPase subunit
MTTEPTIEVMDLTKRYRSGQQALRGVTFSVDRGEIFGYLARNGQGKTTTVRILCGLTRASSGHARVCGRDVERSTGEVQARIGVTLQDPAVDELLTGRELLVFIASLWGLPRRLAKARADELLEAFGLAGSADKRIGTYSAGTRRRLDIAGALVRDPEVLFLDEPTMGLDPQSRRALWREIRRLRSDGTTVFLTTQYIEEAEELADRLVILEGGEIVARGTPAEVRGSTGATTVQLVVPSAVASAIVSRFEGRMSLAEDGRTLTLTVARPEEALRVATDLSESGIDVAQLEIRQASLEDAFLALTGTGLELYEPEPVG